MEGLAFLSYSLLVLSILGSSFSTVNFTARHVAPWYKWDVKYSAGEQDGSLATIFAADGIVTLARGDLLSKGYVPKTVVRYTAVEAPPGSGYMQSIALAVAGAVLTHLVCGLLAIFLCAMLVSAAPAALFALLGTLCSLAALVTASLTVRRMDAEHCTTVIAPLSELLGALPEVNPCSQITGGFRFTFALDGSGSGGGTLTWGFGHGWIAQLVAAATCFLALMSLIVLDLSRIVASRSPKGRGMRALGGDTVGLGSTADLMAATMASTWAGSSIVSRKGAVGKNNNPKKGSAALHHNNNTTSDYNTSGDDERGSRAHPAPTSRSSSLFTRKKNRKGHEDDGPIMPPVVNSLKSLPVLIMSNPTPPVSNPGDSVRGFDDDSVVSKQGNKPTIR